MRYLEKHRQFRGIKFAWAGDGPMREFLEQQIAKFRLGERVHMLGHSWDVAEWFDAADMFILPSLGEGMPAVVLEAMAKGLPVIATPAGGTPEALGDCGHLLPETDDDNVCARALAKAIVNWAGDKKARRSAGARTKFTRKKMLNAYLDVIAETLAAG